MKAAAFALGVAILAAVLWLAAESHYRSCVEEAEARYPVNAGTAESALRERFGIGPNMDVQRRRAIDECSRLPF